MPDLPSRLDLYEVGRQYILQRAKKIDPAQVDVQGSDANVFVGSGSVVSYEVIKQLGYSVGRLLLDGGDGEDLDRYAWDRYQLLRKGASAAVGSVQFRRNSVTGGSGTIPVGSKVVTNDGIEYVTVTPAAFGTGDLLSSADVQATQAGKAFQVGANQVVRFGQNTIPIFDASIAVNNDAATSGGEDRELDEDFRSRIRDFWRTARRGTLGAIAFGALTVPGVASANAVEVTTQGGTPARVVLLYIADSSGVSNRALANKVETALLDFRAAGIAVIVSTSIPQIVSIILRLAFLGGTDTISVGNEVLASVIEYVNSLAVNESLRVSDLGAVLSRFRDDGLVVSTDATTPSNSTIVAPVGDIVPEQGKTLRATTSSVVLAAA